MARRAGNSTITPRRDPRCVFRLQTLRLAKGLTLEQLHERSGVPISTLSDLETGRNALPRDKQLIKIADALGAYGGELISITPPEEIPAK